MTLVAAWRQFGTPCLVADLLVTSSIAGSHAPIPTRDDLDILVPPEHQVSVAELRQKLCRVAGNVVVGWTGNLWAARVVVRSVTETLGGTTVVSRGELAAALNRAGSEVGNFSCELVGIMTTDDGAFCFRWTSSAAETVEIGEVFIGGSGDPYFREIFAPDSRSGDESSVLEAIARTGILLGHEVLYGKTVQARFGGGFQIAYVAGKRIEMVPEVTYIAFVAVEGVDGKLSFQIAPRGLKYRYEYNIAHVMAVIPTESGQPARTPVYWAPPLIEDFLYQPPESLSMRSTYFCIYADVFLRDGLRADRAFPMGYAAADPYIRIIDDGALERTVISQRLLDEIAETVADVDRTTALSRRRVYLR